MDYNISSEKLEHPLLKKLLDELIPVFQKLGIKFFVIGATARDIIMELHGEKSGRRTQDIDIAIAVDKWEEFKTIENEIIQLPDFEKDPKQQQRFLYLRDFQLDIVPYGGITTTEDKIFWPPDQSFAMTVLGFEEAEKDLVRVKIDDTLEIDIVSLAGIFILKLVAWKDRHHKGNKDADDMGFILLNYLNIHEERAAIEHYKEVYEIEDFTTTKAGAALLGVDINILLSDNEVNKAKLKAIIEAELQAAENSILFNQILETNHIKFDDIQDCFQILNQKI
ncbi:nucleotidyl transferase AbiEii/AbiGii toxin family protein [Elizabethkingia meningoseptica]|uniref:nucleotidyl transferase AbiEii/AbiGii toxin family protein n=1 Tax=Elizabethkingia meningoseptica TaxID=238 RepID=UPI0018C26A4E|nr:nucleotidyl transferase AbiEii/AbiGii toxin family protein [Elizabethkingia meningoseptica]MBG0512540.1 nucleotidyl transferase AbiEii/AbiGii toxin family protein [Elizabethkingia meningoseptica]